MRVLLLAAVVAALGFAAGCGDNRAPQPAFAELVPVSGVVNQGGKPASGGVVQFNPDPDKGEFIINSEIGTDGKFNLSTVRATDSQGERKPGAPPGKYKVVYRPALGNQASGGSVDPIDVPTPVTISKAEPDLKIDVPAAKKAK